MFGSFVYIRGVVVVSYGWDGLDCLGGLFGEYACEGGHVCVGRGHGVVATPWLDFRNGETVVGEGLVDEFGVL